MRCFDTNPTPDQSVLTLRIFPMPDPHHKIQVRFALADSNCRQMGLHEGLKNPTTWISLFWLDGYRYWFWRKTSRCSYAPNKAKNLDET